KSVATMIIRKAMGKGTTMGWMGWRAMATAVLVRRGKGCPSFFMSLSSRVEEGNTSLRTGQPSCRFDTGPGKWRYLKAVMLLIALVPLLVGCVDGPLSTLQPASDVTRSVALLWWAMAIGTGVVLLLMVVLAGLALRNDPPRAP